jgi:hypothetical protein
MGHGFHSNLMNYQKIFVGEGLGDRVSRGLQTLKYLQYDFFSSAAHAVSNVLPEQMSFRPMTDAWPKHPLVLNHGNRKSP